MKVFPKEPTAVFRKNLLVNIKFIVFSGGIQKRLEGSPTTSLIYSSDAIVDESPQPNGGEHPERPFEKAPKSLQETFRVAEGASKILKHTTFDRKKQYSGRKSKIIRKALTLQNLHFI